MTRAQIEARVEELARERATFVSEVRRLAAQLGPDDREVLGEVLLARADDEGAFADALERRITARGWLQRLWDRAGSTGRV
jgi:hypothetical protein